MNTIVTILLMLGLVAIIAGVGWRMMDHRADSKERARLVSLQPEAPAVFDRRMVEDLPEPARRYFEFTIAQGTPLYTVADIVMTGQFSIGTKQQPDYMDMQATQALASPHGFLWEMTAKRGLMRVSGSDSGRWTRFWAMGLLPVVRMKTNADHRRSAFGRYTAEAVFWAPASLLPGAGVTWRGIDADSAMATVHHDGLSQDIVIRVAQDGRPVSVELQRWSDANPEHEFRMQPFGGTLSDFRNFDGFTLPTHVEAGNHFGTPDYFAFFIAEVTNITFPTTP